MADAAPAGAAEAAAVPDGVHDLHPPRSQTIHPAPAFLGVGEERVELDNQYRGLPDPDKRSFILLARHAGRMRQMPVQQMPLDLDEQQAEDGLSVLDPEAEAALIEARQRRAPGDRRSHFATSADAQGPRPFAGFLAPPEYDLHEDLYRVDNLPSAMMMARDIAAYRELRNAGGFARPSLNTPESRLVWFDVDAVANSPYLYMHRIYRRPIDEAHMAGDDDMDLDVDEGM